MSKLVIEKNVCPISLVPINELIDPVIGTDTYTYERSKIEEWLKNHGTSPVTREKMSIKDLIVNRALKKDQDNNLKVDDSDKIKMTFVIDKSGSMSTEAEYLTENGSDNGNPIYKKERSGLTHLDLARHVINTAIEIAYELGNIEISIVSFSSNAKLDLPLTLIDLNGKKKALEAVKSIRCGGSTSLWDGLKLGLKNNINGTVFLLTDGHPTYEPPRGWLSQLERFKDANPEITSCLRTFGFGYDLNAKLLQNLSHNSPKLGSFSFIPDAGFIGTVMCHAMANTVVQNRLEVSDDTKIFLDFLEKLINLEDNNLPYSLGNDIIDEYLATNPVIFEEEIKTAFSKQSWYNRWGKIYLRSLYDAHLLRECNNFKDKSISNYKIPEIEKIVDKAENIFENMAPPEPSVDKNNLFRSSGNHYRSLNHGTPTPGGIGAILPPPSNFTMRSFSQPVGGCFHPDCFVDTLDGKTKLRFLKSGDSVKTKNGFKKIKCVIKTKCENDEAKLVKYNNLLVTPWHPIKINNKWTFPATLNLKTDIYRCLYVYTFVLEDFENNMIIEDTECITLGHGIKNDPVATHSFWGENVINCLKNTDGWNRGIVFISKWIRDEQGEVCDLEDISFKDIKNNLLNYARKTNDPITSRSLSTFC